MNRCSVCGSEQVVEYKQSLTSVYSDHPYDLLKCNKCKNIFTSPMPTHDELDDIYRNIYFYDLHFLIQNEKYYRAKRIASYISKGSGTSVLELGSMFGHLLEALGEKGFTAEGIEINKQATDYCKDKNLNVIHSTLEDFLETRPQQYDVVIMSHVLEHILEPKHQLQIIKELISINGHLVLIVPNSLSLTAKVFGRYWGYWQAPVHVNHFNRYSLGHLLEVAGYDIVGTRCMGGDSLLFLSTITNMLRLQSEAIEIEGIKKKIIQLYSFVMKYWLLFGNDDLILTAKVKEQ